MREIDSTSEEGIPEDATLEEVMEDQHRPITKKEEEDSEKILEDFREENSE